MQKSHGSFNEWMDFSDLGQPKTGQPMEATFPIVTSMAFCPGCLRFRGQAKAMDVGKVIQDQAIHQRKSRHKTVNQSRSQPTDGMGNRPHPGPRKMWVEGETCETMVKPLWNKKSLKGKYFYLPKNRCMDWNIWFSRCVAIEFQANLGGGFIFVCIHRCFFYKQNTVN